MVPVPDINYLLWWHVNRYGWLDLPGIGFFESELRQARIDHLNGQIYPSELSLRQGISTEGRADEMVSHICMDTGMSREAMEEQLGALCRYLNESLKKQGWVEFEPYGRISRKDAEQVFESSGFNAHERFTGLGPLPISPVKLQYERTEPPPVPIKPLSPRKSADLRWLYYLLAALWLIFLLLVLWPDRKKEKPGEKPVVAPTESPANMPSEDTAALPAPADSSSAAVPADSSPAFQNEVLVQDHNVSEIDQEVRGKTCVIIVGSFQKSQNADRMKRKVKRDGYQPYTEPYGAFTRVGIRFDCMDRDLQQVLSELKGKYHPQAWVLKH